jgi:pimeloyl-ACP methyl ester carboxylesterase
MISDAQELVTCLKARFRAEKIFLMGFSWGTVIGLWLAARMPQDLYAYIGVSQVVDAAEGERVSLEHVSTAARQAGNQQAVADLSRIDPAYRSTDWFQQIMTERRWLLRFGGVNLFTTIPAVGCPVYFFIGRHDHNVPSQPTQAYYEQLDAPAGKRLVWFERSAHDLFFDEPDRVVGEMRIVLKQNL